jgi:hypothetical protein
MSKIILPGKLGANGTVSVESPIVVKKEKRGRRGLLLFLMAAGLGAVALTSITLLAPVTFYGRMGSPGSIDDSGTRDDGATIPSALAASATATDGKGKVIGDNGMTNSGEMTITGYSDSSSYSTELRCSIDSLPAYCSGTPVTVSGLPPGEHVFTVVEPASDEIALQSFSWNISE